MSKKHFIIFLTILIFLTRNIFAQTHGKKNKLDSLFDQLKTAAEDTTLAKLNYQIGHYLSNHENTDSSLLYFNKALDLAKQTNFDYISTKANNQVAYYYYDHGDLDSCAKYFTRAISFIHSDNPEFYETYTGLGTVCFFKGDNIRSYEYYLKSLKLAELSGKQNLIAKSYGNVGVSLKEQLKFDDALVFFRKALEIGLKHKFKAQTYVALTNIGNIYSEKFEKSGSKYDVESALNYYLKAKEIVMSMLSDEKNRSNAVTLLGNIGNTYADMHDYDKALVVFKEALALMSEGTFLGSRSMLYNNLATIYIEQKNIQEAEKYLKLSRESAYETESPADLMDNYKSSALLYEIKEDYKNAYLYHFRYKKLSDSLFSTEAAEKRKEIELNAEYAKKEAIDKEQQDKKEALAREEKHRQLILRNMFIAGFVLMLLVAFLIFRSYRIKQKSNEIIMQQKLEVEKQKELVEEKQKAILDSIHYAKRIQQSLLPTKKYIDKNLNKL
jgi:tetratricopeptide (TPR) repeat protein